MGLPLSHNPMYHITLLVTQNGTNGGLCTSIFIFLIIRPQKFCGRIMVSRCRRRRRRRRPVA